MTFPNWARIALGLLIGLLGYLISGEYLHVSEELRGALSSIVATLAAAGFVPPRPGSVLLPQPVRLALTVLTPIVTYVLNTAPDFGATLRGILIAVITFLASILIVPPQVPHPPQAGG